MSALSQFRPVAHSGPLVRWSVVGRLGLALFCLLTVLVQLRVFVAIDLAVTRAKQPLVRPIYDTLGEMLAFAVSTEFCVVYAAILAVLLWRAGVGRRSLLPFAFLLLEPIEVGLKAVVDQPPVPDEFYRGVYYPLTTIVFQGTFPSGHALRTAFFCVFAVAMLAWRWPRLVPSGVVLAAIIIVLCGFSRVYLGYHWLSDVVAGAILGGSAALIVAQPILALPRLRFDGLPAGESVE